ncbi:recombinase family protein [Methylophaga pinxianii]|nr:recombinase family protein [Methylophaga pinxianii]
MQAGTTSARGIASALNQRGILTARGGQWHQSTVSNLLKRLNMH